MSEMNRLAVLVSTLLFAGTFSLAQQPADPNTSSPDAGNKSSGSQSSARKDPAAPPRSDGKASDQNSDDQESSSRDTRLDTTPPKDDAKNHPNSQDVVSDLEAPAEGSAVQEFHPWNPLKANKDIQVGNFYFNRKNYKGALERYKDALYYKQNDAVATFRVGECEEKLGHKEEAKKSFEQYLKILPDGPLAKEAHSQLAKLEKAK
jgi:tetratricopeptide (TPR) repeat protein